MISQKESSTRSNYKYVPVQSAYVQSANSYADVSTYISKGQIELMDLRETIQDMYRRIRYLENIVEEKTVVFDYVEDIYAEEWRET